MKNTIKKSVAFFMAVMMLLPFFSSTALAVDEGALPLGRTIDFETAIYKEIGGVWSKVARVNPGDAVKVRVFAKTDYVAGNAEFTIFYDSDFFSDSYPKSFSNKIIFNEKPGFFTVTEKFDGVFSVKGATPKALFPLLKRGLITDEYYESHGYFSASVDFLDRQTVYDNSDWMCEFDLTVKSDATGTGDVCICPGTECNSKQTVNNGINFPAFDEIAGGAIGSWLWQETYGYEPVYNISSNPVGVPGAAMSVSLNYQEITLDCGKTCTVRASVLPSDTTNKSVSWSSSNPAVATVDGNGVVTGVSNGTAVITVTTADGGFTDTCNVTVNTPVSGISFDFTQVTVAPGASKTLTADISPASANLTNLLWSSSNTSVATVDKNGVVTGIAEGSAIITVHPMYNPYFVEKKCTVTVAHSATGIEMNLLSSNLDSGKTLPLSVTFTPANTTNKSVSWSSSNPAVATVDENGVVTGISSGTAVITVTTEDGGFTAQCSVSVVTRVSQIILSQTELTVKYKKESPTLSASVIPSSADNQSVAWSSENEKIARVDQSGKITARDMGTTYIVATAEDGSVTARCRVTVTMTFFQRVIRWFKILFGTWNTTAAMLSRAM